MRVAAESTHPSGGLTQRALLVTPTGGTGNSVGVACATRRSRDVAEAVRAGGPVGIMLHHAVTDDGEFAALSALLALLTTHPNTRATSLTALAAVPG